MNRLKTTEMLLIGYGGRSGSCFNGDGSWMGLKETELKLLGPCTQRFKAAREQRPSF